MGFEQFRDRYGRTLIWTYTDDLLDSIYKRKDELEIDIEKEVEELKNLKGNLEDEYDEACKKRDAIVDWDSPEMDEAEDLCGELAEKISAVEDIIDYLEKVKHGIWN